MALAERNYVIPSHTAWIPVAESYQGVMEFLGGLGQGETELIKPVLADKDVFLRAAHVDNVGS